MQCKRATGLSDCLDTFPQMWKPSTIPAPNSLHNRPNDDSRALAGTSSESVWDAEALKPALEAALATEQVWRVFQPLVDIQSGATVGFEVLARWTYNAERAIPPSRFIPTRRLVPDVSGFHLYPLSRRQMPPPPPLRVDRRVPLSKRLAALISLFQRGQSDVTKIA